MTAIEQAVSADATNSAQRVGHPTSDVRHHHNPEDVMIKSKTLRVARETVRTLSSRDLHGVQGGVVIPPHSGHAGCEPSGIRACEPPTNP